MVRNILIVYSQMFHCRECLVCLSTDIQLSGGSMKPLSVLGLTGLLCLCFQYGVGE